MSLNGTIPETKCVNDYVTSIATHLKSSSKSWMGIAQDFAEAKDKLNKKEFKQLIVETRFSYSTVYKLIMIANSDRIKKYQDKLSRISAWSTLHEIVKLDEDKFAEFEKKYLSDSEPRYFQRSDVVHIKNGTCANQRSDFNVLATFKVNLKQIDPDGIEKIQKGVEKFAEKLSENELVQFEVNDLTEKLNSMMEEQASKELAAVEREAKRRQMKRLREVIKLEKSKLPRKDRLKAFVKKFGIAEEEILDPREDLNVMLVELDHEPLTVAEMYG